MSRTLYLVSCVSRKLDRPARARDLYRSDWFRKARAYVERCEGSWRILSAEHGLLRPDEVVDPYERTLVRMPIGERRRWARRVLAQLEGVELRPGDRVVLFAGERYREFLVDELERRGLDVEVPLRGLGIGEQLSWFKQRLAQ